MAAIEVPLSHIVPRRPVQSKLDDVIHENRRLSRNLRTSERQNRVLKLQVGSSTRLARIDEEPNVYGIPEWANPQLCCMFWFVCATLLLAGIVVVVAL